MRFKKMLPFGEFSDTPRKRAALARSQRRQRDAFPLLAPIIAETQPDADTVMRERAADWVDSEAAWRKRRADGWRRARARLFGYGPNLRAALRRAWSLAGCPADPVYLLDTLHGFETGALDFGEDGRLYTRSHIEWLAQRRQAKRAA